MVKHKAIKFNIPAIDASLDSDSGPLIYGTPESPARIEGEVVFECDYECKGTMFVLTYAAVVDVSVNTLQDYHTDSTYFDKKVFQYQLRHPTGRLNYLTPNVYRFPFAFNVSSDHPTSFDSNGARMRYLLEARLVRKRSRCFKKTVVVHVHNTVVVRDPFSTSSIVSVPSESTLGPTAIDTDMGLDGPYRDPIESGKDATSLSPWSPSETTLALMDSGPSAASPNPTLQRFSGVWAGRLPYEVNLPTLTLLWGHTIPITIRVYRPSGPSAALALESNSPQGRSLAVGKVVRVNVSVEQERVIHAGVSICTSRHEVLQAAWDCSSDGWTGVLDPAKPIPAQNEKIQARSPLWQKVLLFHVPWENATKNLPPTIDCKCLKIDYILKVTLNLIPYPEKNREAMEVPMKMVVPRPPHEPTQPFNMNRHMASLNNLPDEPMVYPAPPTIASYKSAAEKRYM
ncbi:hypothetical protein EC968_001525 [Mortierella alpina]|nr:hypothetical protein EC968_001525 [Mortierella alpina]